MSAEAVRWAVKQTAKATDKAVLLCLARHHSMRSGFAKVTQTEVAEEVGIARETVLRVVKRLVGAGQIAEAKVRVKGRKWLHNVYLLNPSGGGIQRPARRRRSVTQDHTSREKGYARAPSQVIHLNARRASGGDA